MYKRIIGEFANSDLKQIIGKKGFQNDIIALFDDFFENKNNLATYSNDYLIQDYLSYKKNNLHLYRNALLEVNSLLQEAKSICAETTWRGIAYFQPISAEMGNKYWSMIKLQNDFNELEAHEYVSECFTLIENTCENLLKYLFALMVYMIRVTKGKTTDLNEIKKIKFGIILNELKQSNMLNLVMSIVESEISISQWRNIACHKTYQYINGKINCQYGQNLEYNTTINSKEDLLHITKSIYKVAQVLILPTKLFLYDNIEQVRNILDELSLDIVNFREEDWQLIYVTELLANGFIILDIICNDKMRITVQDTQDENAIDRAILIPLAAYKAWVLTGKNEIEIVYIQNNGEPYVSISLTSDVCEKVSNYEKDFSYLAEKMVVKRY